MENPFDSHGHFNNHWLDDMRKHLQELDISQDAQHDVQANAPLADFASWTAGHDAHSNLPSSDDLHHASTSHFSTHDDSTMPLSFAEMSNHSGEPLYFAAPFVNDFANQDWQQDNAPAADVFEQHPTPDAHGESHHILRDAGQFHEEPLVDWTANVGHWHHEPLHVSAESSHSIASDGSYITIGSNGWVYLHKANESYSSNGTWVGSVCDGHFYDTDRHHIAKLANSGKVCDDYDHEIGHVIGGHIFNNSNVEQGRGDTDIEAAAHFVYAVRGMHMSR